MTSPRQCENWIATYREWTVDRTQVAYELIDWSAIFTLAAVLGRKIAFTRHSAFLGGWDCYPYLYVIVVGPSGIGKTTTVRFSFDLLDQIPDIPKPPTFVTVEGLIDDMIKAPNSSIFVTVEEFGDIMMKDPHGKMYEFLTSLYDGKANIRQKTLSRNLEFADKPCLNLFAGTTPEWVADNIPFTTLNGGFGSRVIWLYIPELRRRRMYYREEMKKTDFLSIEKRLVADLSHIAKLEGEYTISEEAMDFMEGWNANIPNNIKYKKIAGYIARKAVFVHKLALIMHVAYSDSKEVNLLDFQNAIKLIESLEPKLPKIFAGVGKNEYTLEMNDIAEFIKESPGILDSEVREVFKAAASPAKLAELIEGMLLANVLRSENDDKGKRTLYFVED